MDVTIPQLLPFCLADPVFFDAVARMPDQDSRFTVAGRDTPAGWTRREHDLWIEWRPADVALPPQGWKVHVSACLADADRAGTQVWDFCVERRIALKVLRSRAALRLSNGKYADRGSSGKLITLYPADERQFAEILPALAELLRDVTGPYVLSDLRYEDSPISVRYGGFAPVTYRDPDGRTVYAIRDPDGHLVPDDRTPAFTVPPWADVPAVLSNSLSRLEVDGGELPYDVERALHFSNSGGVYLARDRSTGAQVVLREARPHAGLDARGDDAVTRLRHEYEVLRRLAGLDVVPRALDYLVIWEHHFLVEEFIDGETLMAEVFARQPLVDPAPSEQSLAAYTGWATDVLAKVDHALMSLHAAGVAFGDLHPGNVILRPDGRIALVDFEVAGDLTGPAPALAAPGFAAPPGLTRRDADAYLLNCLRQWVFLPISPLTDRDPVKLGTVARVIGELYPVPASFGPRLLRGLQRGRDPIGEDTAAAMFDTDTPDWPAIRDSLAAGILATATPERADRLYPGDPQQFGTGGFSLANGAAGVLAALHRAGAEIPGEHVDWLIAAARRAPDPRPGLYDGLHGAAATLELLGRPDEAMDLLDRARRQHRDLAGLSLHSGLAGAGLNLLRFAAATGDERLRTEALDLGDRLAGRLGADPAGQAGLQYGLTGVALFFLRLHDHTGDPAHLDLARDALRREMTRGQTLPDGTFQLVDGTRYLAYLGTGSAGLAVVVNDYLARRDDPEFAGVVDGARLACRSAFIRHPALFQGRAGTILALGLLGVPEDQPVIRTHVRRLGWYALSHRGHLAFPGNQLLRLSADLATGAAGVLVALDAVFNPGAPLVAGLELSAPALVETEGR
jgi:predicted Ser/Thr protein kinase